MSNSGFICISIVYNLLYKRLFRYRLSMVEKNEVLPSDVPQIIMIIYYIFQKSLVWPQNVNSTLDICIQFELNINLDLPV